MTSIRQISKILVAALIATTAGCAGAGDWEVEGLYYLESSFATPRGLPDTESAQLDAFTDLSANPDNVGGWMLELLENELDEPYSTALKYARNGLEGDRELTEYLNEHAADMVADLLKLSSSIEQVVTNPRLSSELELTLLEGTETEGFSTHTVTGVVFVIDDVAHRYDMEEMDMASVAPTTTDFRIHEDNWISYGDHGWHLPYGQILDYAINTVITESIDPYADNFTDVIASRVPCNSVGQWVKDKLDFGKSEIFAIACAAAVDKAAAEMVPLDLADIEADITVGGDAQLADQNDDGNVDSMLDGAWEGELQFDSQMVRLRRPDQTFFGSRSRAKRWEDDIN